MNINQITEILNSYSTPMYVYDISELKTRVAYLRSRLPDKVALCYAIKANTFILDHISPLVERIEICSPGELRICQSLCLPSNQFVISGVYKTPELMRLLILEGSADELYTVESIQQFELLLNSAKQAKHKIRILLRLTSGNQFGLDEDDLLQIIKQHKDNQWLDIKGIQYFSGTQKDSLKKLKREILYLDNLLFTLENKYGFLADELEYGPGFPISYFVDHHFNEELFLEGFASLISEMHYNGKIYLELGRSIAASCGTYLTSIVDLKRNKGQNYAIVDGGIHHLVYYGQSMAMRHPIIHHFFSYCDYDSTENEYWNIYGSLCTINDILVKQYPMQPPHLNDVLVFKNTGAYCATEGIALFLSRDLPAVILLQPDGRAVCAREHTATDMLNNINIEKR